MKILAYKLKNGLLMNESTYDFLMKCKEEGQGYVEIDRKQKKKDCEIEIDMLEGLEDDGQDL